LTDSLFSLLAAIAFWFDYASKIFRTARYQHPPSRSGFCLAAHCLLLCTLPDGWVSALLFTAFCFAPSLKVGFPNALTIACRITALGFFCNLPLSLHMSGLPKSNGTIAELNVLLI